MPHHCPVRLLATALLFLVVACSPPEPRTQQQTPAASASNGASGELPFNTRATIRDVMNTLIDPHVDALWNAVRIVVDEQGVQEYAPETEEEWEALRRNALSLIEGGNALMIPGRRVAPEGAGAVYPDYEYLPGEVAEKLEQDPDSWVGFARGLQQSVLPALEAVEARDTEALIEAGEAINAACEACHTQYWYRPGSGQPENP